MGTHRKSRLRKTQPVQSRLRTSWRPDISGLRALAIIMVVSMHVGLIDIHGGVDVSFVLSGFLITSILLREIDKTGRINYRAFMAKRFRRLLPGAALVIGVTLLLVWKFTPLQFKEVATDGSLAAVSALNWRLVEEGTDYFAADGSQTAFQHFWSLGIEEQFYLAFPFALMLLAWAGRKTLRSNRIVTGFGMAVLVGWSFYECYRLTSINQPLAYFGSYTRVWELGAGVLLACCAVQVSRMNQLFAAFLMWAGLATIVVTGLLITEETPLPGVAVLGPVLGALMVIAGGCATPKYSPEWLLGHWSTKIIADNSYALYLTHWPVLLLWEPVVGYQVTTVGDKLRVIAVSFILAVLIYYPFMKRIQQSKSLIHRPHFNLASFGGVTASVAGVALAAAVWAPLNIPTATAADQAPRTINASVVKQAVDLEELPGNVQPSLVDAPKDMARAGCIDQLVEKTFVMRDSCIVGDPRGKETIVLIGDSHAYQWGETLSVIGKQRGIRVVVMTKAGCSPTAYNVYNPNLKRVYTECESWRSSALKAIDELQPQAVVVTGRTQKDATAKDAGRTFKRLKEITPRVVYLTDTPYPLANIPNCLASNQQDVDECSRTTSQALDQPDVRVMERSVAEVSGLIVVDAVPMFCTKGTCPAVIGNRIVYYDYSHMTATYAKSLAPWLGKEIEAALR